MNSKVRLKQIASSLDVSITTVFRALKDADGVSKKTKTLVFEKARELGYDFDQSSLSDGKKGPFSVAVICPYDFFFETVVEGMKAAIGKISPENINIEFKFFEATDAVMQSEQLREIIKDNKYDGVVITPGHPLMLNPLINALVDNGTTVITVNTDAPSSNRLVYIGQDAFIAGKMAAQMLGLKIKAGEQAAYFTSFETTVVKGRTEGFISFLQENYPDIDLIGPFEYIDNVDEAARIVRQVILNNPDVGLLFPNNMAGTLGCARAVAETGNKGKIFVVGFDHNDEIERYINEDIIVATILQYPFNQGYLTINTLVKELMEEGRTEEVSQHIGCSLLMKSNLGLYRDR